MLKKIIISVLAVSCLMSFSLQADATNLDWELAKAVIKGNPKLVEQYLKDGANVNAVVNGEPILIQAVREIFKEADGYYGMVVMYVLLCMGAWAIDRVTRRLPLILQAVNLYLSYKMFVSCGRLLEQTFKNYRMRVLTLLLEHPTINLNITNAAGRTALTVAQEYQAKNPDGRCAIRSMERVKALFEEKQNLPIAIKN